MAKMKKRELLELLQALKKCNSSRNAVLNHLDDNSCEAIYEVIANVLQNPRVSPSSAKKLKRKLAPHKNTLRYLATPTRSKKVKRKKLVQMGGSAFSTILNTAIPLLLPLLL